MTCPLFITRVSAGFPSPADDYLDENLNLHEYLVQRPAATFFLRAAGDSMAGIGIQDGDLLVVDRSLTARPGAVVIAALDGDLTVKRLERRGGAMVLAAANERYPPIPLNGCDDLVIWGVVVYAIHAL